MYLRYLCYRSAVRVPHTGSLLPGTTIEHLAPRGAEGIDPGKDGLPTKVVHKSCSDVSWDQELSIGPNGLVQFEGLLGNRTVCSLGFVGAHNTRQRRTEERPGKVGYVRLLSPRREP
jgi:hypothetical protein